MIPNLKDYVRELAEQAAAEREKFVESMLHKHLTEDDLELFNRYRQLNEYFATRVNQIYRPHQGLYHFGVKIYDTEYFYDEIKDQIE